ncbi:sigma-70 family RNA polymerase sigma factor [Flagellimonas algicola]|uniref:Sigma-70 family RNA polymerase sigma factor n=2 Tax=Flagellimonas algicola TaxID=2583815 RepID=A0ABY2WID0_9FLAO|nr:sigma-70 family RNA polymerase sigma factor [Allomuricauda algicola]TMU54609.1 sigma-70 family RNA polymerase sigma factor [Allomuricauda algicola]
MIMEIKDEVLVKKYMEGNEAVLGQLINKHNRRISGYIFSKVKDREITEDIFQDTFVKVIKTLKRGDYREQGKFLPWVMQIAHNLIVDYLRKRRRLAIFESKDDFDIFSVIEDGEPNAESNLIKQQLDKNLIRLVEQLHHDQKEVLMMRIFRGMSYTEISENTGVGINTALGRMRYALINLRKLVESQNVNIME